MKSIMHAWQVIGARIQIFIGFLIGITGIGFIILIHEFGHFIACKLFGVATPLFSIGFGPRLIATTIGDTVFQIAALPLGGYVEIASDALANQSYLNKMIIVLAGIAANFIFAYIIFLYLSIRRKEQTTIIETISPESPAYNAGMMPGDRILMINDRDVTENPLSLVQTIWQSAGRMVSISYERDGIAYHTQLPVKNHHSPYGTDIGSLFISFQEKPITHHSFFGALSDVITSVNKTIYSMGLLFATAFRKEQRTQLTGPVGIINITRKSFAMGSHYFLFFLAILSINIGIFNLLPIPFFDGGKAVLYTAEQIVGPINQTVIDVISQLFLYIVLIILVIITMKDIMRMKKI